MSWRGGSLRRWLRRLKWLRVTSRVTSVTNPSETGPRTCAATERRDERRAGHEPAAGVRRLISWLRVSLAVWRCVELEPVLATAGADYARYWRAYIASLCAPRALVARCANSG